MKKLLTTTMVLGSTALLAACASGTFDNNNLDETITQAPYAEERTVGATQSAPVRRAPVVRSAAPVFESSQVK